MRILHVTKKYPGLVGGDAAAVRAIAEEQRRRGNDVRVVTSNAPEVAAGPDVVTVGPRISGEDLDRASLRRALLLGGLWRWSRAGLRDFRPHLVHSHSADMGYVVAAACRGDGIPVVHTCHGITFPHRRSHPVRARLESLLLRRSGFSRVVTVYPSSLGAFRAEGIGGAVFIPNGVDIPPGVPRGEGAGVFTFLAVGRLEAQKGLDDLLEASRLLGTTGASFRVNVVGRGSLRGPLERLRDGLGLSGVVHFAGALSDRALARERAAADAYVLTSRWEGFPITLLEAWAAGLPVVATRVGGVSDFCVDGENALTVEPGDVRSIADAMRRMMEEAPTRSRLAANGIRAVEARFTWPAVVDRLDSLYAEVVSGEARP